MGFRLHHSHLLRAHRATLARLGQRPRPGQPPEVARLQRACKSLDVGTVIGMIVSCAPSREHAEWQRRRNDPLPTVRPVRSGLG